MTEVNNFYIIKTAQMKDMVNCSDVLASTPLDCQ